MFRIALRNLAVPATASIFCNSAVNNSASAVSETHEHHGSNTLINAVGNTPLIYLPKLSQALGRHVFGKAEWLNPSGSVKDRAAKQIILEAQKDGSLLPGGTICEGTGGNTGIALAALGASMGYKVVLTMPNCIAEEKVSLARRYGAEILLQPLVPFNNPENYARKAESLGIERENAIFTNQFENLANFRAHYTSTGPEIWAQSSGKVDAFVCAAGTGGTLAGISAFLKKASGGRTRCYLVDPHGSALFQFVKSKLVEVIPGQSSQIEGIGISRITNNFKEAQLDGAFQASDQEAIQMVYYLMKHEGLCVGPSAALNVCGAVKAARNLKEGSTVVTVLCDAGERYNSKIFNSAWLKSYSLEPNVGDASDLSFVK